MFISAFVGNFFGRISAFLRPLLIRPHRAVGNGQAAKFHSTLSLLPHLPDAAG